MRYACCVLFIVYLSGASGNPRGGEMCWCVPPIPCRADAALAPLYGSLSARESVVHRPEYKPDRCRRVSQSLNLLITLSPNFPSSHSFIP